MLYPLSYVDRMAWSLRDPRPPQDLRRWERGRPRLGGVRPDNAACRKLTCAWNGKARVPQFRSGALAF